MARPYPECSMLQYHDLVKRLISQKRRGDRTGVGTRSLFAEGLNFDCSMNMPYLTTKKLFLRGVFVELLWFISGSTDVRKLQEQKVKIWDEWTFEDGSMGPGYSHQWRHFGAGWRGVDADYSGQGVDQITDVINSLRTNPYSRRHIVSAWNPTCLDQMGLPPCHVLFQFYVRDIDPIEMLWVVRNHPRYKDFDRPLTAIENNGTSDLYVMDAAKQLGISDKRLDLQMYQRSADVFLGVPFNIASYATLLAMMAKVVDMNPGRLHIQFGDVHIYENHIEQAKTMLERTPMSPAKLVLNGDQDHVQDFVLEDLEVVGYKSHPAIKAPIAV